MDVTHVRRGSWDDEFEKKYSSIPSRTSYVNLANYQTMMMNGWDAINERKLAVLDWWVHFGLQGMVSAKHWDCSGHHRAHAAVGFYDSPFGEALILSYDGGYPLEGTTHVFHASRQNGISELQDTENMWTNLQLGEGYNQMSIFIPDMALRAHEPIMAVAGQTMAYAALGEIVPDWLRQMRDTNIWDMDPNRDPIIENAVEAWQMRAQAITGTRIPNETISKNFAATMQEVD